MDSQNIQGDQQHRQSGLSEVPRQLHVEPREMEYLSWSFTANQPTSAGIGSDIPLSTTHRTAKPLSWERVLNEPGRKISTQERQYKADLNPERIESPPTKKRRILRNVEARNKEEVAAKRRHYLLKNCREVLYEDNNNVEQPLDFPFPI